MLGSAKVEGQLRAQEHGYHNSRGTGHPRRRRSLHAMGLVGGEMGKTHVANIQSHKAGLVMRFGARRGLAWNFWCQMKRIKSTYNVGLVAALTHTRTLTHSEGRRRMGDGRRTGEDGGSDEAGGRHDACRACFCIFLKRRFDEVSPTGTSTSSKCHQHDRTAKKCTQLDEAKGGRESSEATENDRYEEDKFLKIGAYNRKRGTL